MLINYFISIVVFSMFVILFIFTSGTTFAPIFTQYAVFSTTWFLVSISIFCLVFSIAGYYLKCSLMFAMLLVVEKKYTVWQAIKTSFFAFNQHWFKIIVMYLVMGFIIVVSTIPASIPLIWTIPMLFNLQGIVYRNIFGVEEGR
jgi:hypothetical protein